MASSLSRRCGRCGKEKTGGAIFYIVRLTLTCDFDGELEDLSDEGLAREMKKQLQRAERMSAEELMDEVYQEIYFCLCKNCRDWLVSRERCGIFFQGADND